MVVSPAAIWRNQDALLLTYSLKLQKNGMSQWQYFSIFKM